MFALECGIVGFNQQLLNMICMQQEDNKVEVAEMIGSLVSFLIYLVVAKNSSASQSPCLEVGKLEEYLVKEVFPKLEKMTVKEAVLRFRKILMSRVLEGSVNSDGDSRSQISMEELVEGATDDGYEAGHSDDKNGGGAGVREFQSSVLFKPGLKLYTTGLLSLAIGTGHGH